MASRAQGATPLWAGDVWGLSPALGVLLVVVGASLPVRIEGRMGLNSCRAQVYARIAIRGLWEYLTSAHFEKRM